MAQERKTSGRRDAAGGPIPLELPPDRAFVLHLDPRARPPRRVVGRIEHVTFGRIANVALPWDTSGAEQLQHRFPRTRVVGAWKNVRVPVP